MQNRKRNIQKKFFVSEKEERLIRMNMNKVGIVDSSSFTSDMIINGKVNIVSTVEVDAVNKLSSKVSK